MSLRIEKGLPVINEMQLCADHWPGQHLPPWQIRESEFHSLDRIALSQGMVRFDAQIMGYVEWFDERIIVVFKTIEDQKKKGYYRYFAFPVDEDRWNALEEETAS